MHSALVNTHLLNTCNHFFYWAWIRIMLVFYHTWNCRKIYRKKVFFFCLSNTQRNNRNTRNVKVNRMPNATWNRKKRKNNSFSRFTCGHMRFAIILYHLSLGLRMVHLYSTVHASWSFYPKTKKKNERIAYRISEFTLPKRLTTIHFSFH